METNEQTQPQEPQPVAPQPRAAITVESDYYAVQLSVRGYDERGRECMWNVRGRTTDEFDAGLAKYGERINKLSGIKRVDENTPTSASGTPQSAPAPNAQESQTGGTYHCVLLKVGQSYKGNKPQLQFEVAEQDKPITFTGSNSSELAKFLQPVGAFQPAQLVNGAKFQVNYLVDWQMSAPNSEGKQYKNIVGLRMGALK